jgi:hypothetical protein
MSKPMDNSTDLQPPLPDTLRLGSAADLLAAIPYLVGFHPVESLVLVGLAANRVSVTARLDLVDCGSAELRHALGVLTRADSDGLLAVVFSEMPAEVGAPWTVVVDALLDLAEWEQLRVGPVLVVRDGKFWDYRDAFDDGAGRPLQDSCSPAAASATYAGLVARPDRDALLAVLEQDDEFTRSRLDDELADQEAVAVTAILGGAPGRHARGVKRAIFTAARQSDETLSFGLPSVRRERELCRFAVALTDVRIRDAVWVAVDQKRLGGLSLWQEMLRCLPSPYDAAPLFLFGWASWREGDGVLAAEAALRALDSDPGYTAAELLFSAVQNGLDPHRTPRLRSARR